MSWLIWKSCSTVLDWIWRIKFKFFEPFSHILKAAVTCNLLLLYKAQHHEHRNMKRKKQINEKFTRQRDERLIRRWLVCLAASVFHTLTCVCVAQRLLCVQADADVSSVSWGWVAAGAGALVVSAPTAGRALGPGGPAGPGAGHWHTQQPHLAQSVNPQGEHQHMKHAVTWTGLDVAVLVLYRGAHTGPGVGPALCCQAAALPGPEASGTLLRTAGPGLPGPPADTLRLGEGSPAGLHQVLDQSWWNRVSLESWVKIYWVNSFHLLQQRMKTQRDGFYLSFPNSADRLPLIKLWLCRGNVGHVTNWSRNPLLAHTQAPVNTDY